ncbi:MAG: hypothetical protein OXC07_00645 [Kistimonas sp.]|nr:hypothetical protein [Kistimonas sp.]
MIRDLVDSAIDRARRRDDWPRPPGTTTVYRLVERILYPETRSG